MTDVLKKDRVKFDFNIIILIAFFSSRFLTKLLSIPFGVKGVLMCMGLLAVLYIIGIGIKIKEKDYNFLFFFTIFFGLLFLTSLSYYYHDEIGYWLVEKDFGFLIKVFNVRDSISALLVILLVDDKKQLLKGLEIIAYINAVYILAQILIFYKVGDWSNYFVTFEGGLGSSYNMNLGYDLIFISFIFLATFLKNPKKILNMILSIITMSYAIVFGSRGVLVLIIAFLFLYLVFFFGELKKDKRIRYLSIVLVGVFILTLLLPKVNKYFIEKNKAKFENMTEEELIKYEEEYGEVDESKFDVDEKPRNLEMIKQGDFFESNGRFTIWKYGFEAFKDSPIIGRGVFGDRPYVGKHYVWGYSHNIAVELAANFGIVGIAFGIYMVVLLIYTFIKKDRDTKYLFLIFSAMLSKLLLSDSFYFSYIFWAVIGLLYLTHFDKRRKYKLKLSITILLFLTFIAGLGLALRRDYKNQDFRHVELKKPTFMIAITDYDSRYLKDIKNIISDNNIEASFFKDPEQPGYTALLREGFDVQDFKTTSSSYRVIKNDEVQKHLEISEAIRKDVGYDSTSAYIPPRYYYSSPIRYFLSDKVMFLLDKSHKLTTYKDINEANRLFLKGNQISIEEDDTKSKAKKESALEKTYDQIKNEKYILIDDIIKTVQDKDNLAILDFKLKDKDNIDLFKYTMDKIKSNNIETLNFEELSKDVKTFEEGVDLKKNLIKNSKIIYFFKGFLN